MARPASKKSTDSNASLGFEADYVLANPSFKNSDWFRNDNGVRRQFDVPSKSKANFAWVQHFIRHLARQEAARMTG